MMKLDIATERVASAFSRRRDGLLRYVLMGSDRHYPEEAPAYP
jgi:hypothetical protein